jgi:la-related protein 1
MLPPVNWAKERPAEDLPSEMTNESYTVFRRKALKQREQLSHGQCNSDMEILYKFWSHFLPHNFNSRMYEEFRKLAFDDSMQRDSSVGLRSLIAFYDECILNQEVVSDELVRDYVELVKAEAEQKKKARPAFDKLRAAWRNGALPLKNRVKIDKLVGADLKNELER